MQARPERVILIHGAWAGGWVWARLIGALAIHGVMAEALELPGNGTHPMPVGRVREPDLHAALGDAIAAEPGPVALVGHSGGGMLVTAAAERYAPRVSHAIWIAGMLLPGGESFDEVQAGLDGGTEALGVTPHVTSLPALGASTVAPEAARRFFFDDLPRDEALAFARRLTAQPDAGRRLRTPTGAAFSALPKLYILATRDRSVVPEAQRRMASHATGLHIVEIDSGHCPHLSQPTRVAQLIAEFLRTPPSGCTSASGIG